MNWKHWILFPMIVILLGWAALFGVVILRERDEQLAAADAIFIPGCMIWGDQPSPTLEERLSCGLTLYQQGYAPLICVSGGQGADEILPEAQVMREYLIARGVPASCIIMEDTSRNTRENLMFSTPLLRKQGVNTLLIVTSAFHRYRTVRIARDIGWTVTGYAPAAVPPVSKWLYRVRETASLMKEWLLGRSLEL